MDKRKLIIDGTEVPLSVGEAIPITRSVVDITEPWNRKSDHTKEFLLPASKEANKVFNYIFDINTDSTYNPGLKLPAQYLEGGETIIDGFVRMLNIVETDDQEKFYQIQVLGSVSNIFREFGEKELNHSTMLWSELDHQYTAIVQSNSWDTSYELNGISTPFAYGSGYLYAPIYRGRWLNHISYRTEDLQPQTYVREICLRMFNAAGYTWNSVFLDSDYFKRLVIPMNIEGDMALGEAGITPRLFEVDTPKVNATTDTTITLVQDVETDVTIRHSVEINDPSNAYDSVTTGIWTVPQTGYYNLISHLSTTLTMVPTAAANDVIFNGSALVTLSFVRGSGIPLATSSVWITSDINVPIIGRTTSFSGGTFPDNDYNSQKPSTDLSFQTKTTYPKNYYQPSQTRIITPNVYLFAGETVKTNLQYHLTLDEETDSFGTPWGGTNGPGWFVDTVNPTISYDGVNTLNFQVGEMYNTISNPQLITGASVNYNTVLPIGIKQTDFFKSIINMHNLFITQDPESPKILNIEPAMDFYGNTKKDWSEKYAQNKPKTTTPLGAIKGLKYDYTYKADKDYYNELYLAEWGRIFGNREFYVNNDFEKGEVKTEVIFSPTISVGNPSSTMIVPWIVKEAGGVPVSSNIRILYYGGLKPTNIDWRHYTAGLFPPGIDYYSTYPYLGMWDDPYNPTLSIEFGLSQKVYWTDILGTITVSNNTLFNKYYKQYVEEIIDPNSKIVKGWFALTPYDIRTADFRFLYWWDNAFYRLNKINNYKENQLTECEFLKLNHADPFAGSLNVSNGWTANFGDDIIGVWPGDGIASPVPKGDYTVNPDLKETPRSQETTINGTGNIVPDNVRSVVINSDFNLIGQETQKVMISGGGNNVVQGGLRNVTLINTSDVTVKESNVTYINGQKTGGNAIEFINAAGKHDQDFIFKGYELDTTAGAVEILMKVGPFEGYEQTFKKVAGDYDLILDCQYITPTTLIEGETEIRIATINDAVTVYWNGIEWKIK